MKKVLLVVMLSMAFFAGSQIVSTNTTYADVHVDDVTVFERSIGKTNDYYTVKVLYDGARHPSFLAFRQKGGVWQYGDAVLVDMGKEKWSPVSGNKRANDILYIVLQYI